MNIKHSIIGIVAAIIFVGCQKEVIIKQLPYTSSVSIQCLLEPGTFPKVYFYRTVPYFNSSTSFKDLFIADATVHIFSDAGDEILHIDSSYNNFFCYYEYFYSGNIAVEQNLIYTLDINHGGEIYTSTTTTDRIAVQIDSTSFVPQFHDVYGEHEGVVFFFTDEPMQTNYYRFEMHRMIDSSSYGAGNVISPCLTNEKHMVREIGRTIYTDDNVNGGQITFTIEPTYKHKAGDTVYLFMQSCDVNMYHFYDQLDQQKLTQFNPFVEPVYVELNQFPNAFGVIGSFIKSDSILFIYPE